MRTSGIFSQRSWSAHVVTKRLFFVAVTVALAGCTLKNQPAPALAGPSSQALSMALTASPDIITQDGLSQSIIGITTYDANGQPLRGVSLRAQMAVNGVVADFGKLSTSAMSTDNSGHASLTYTSPAPPPASASSDNVVSIVVTPVGTNFDNTVDASKAVSIRLARPGVILPPQGAPVASFVFSPTTPRENDNIIFDASASTSAGTIVSYSWTFGDGGTGTGVHPSYQYDLVGTYNVVLTITDDRGQTATTSKTVTITAGADPSVTITASPKTPIAGQAMNLSAAGSKASSGHTISGYEWDFGDGSPHGSGLSVSHIYAAAGSYTVILTVTDDQGRTATGTADVTVATSGPTAAFTFAAVSSSTTVNFNAAGSTAIEGRTITGYSWDFGDGSSATGVAPSHTFPTEGPFTVTLRVTDSAGQTGTLVRQITVRITP